MMEYFNLYFYNSHKVVLDQPEYQKFIPWSDDEFGDIFEVSVTRTMSSVLGSPSIGTTIGLL